MNTILLIGANGQLGWELRHTLANLGNVIACTHNEMDLCDADAIVSKIRNIKPDIIVNAAAYTAVDRAESEPELAMKINATAPLILAKEAKRLNALLIHFSTDYVFDGKSQQPYTESDLPNPINIYGKSKLAGEKNIEAIGGCYIILRTSWVYSTRGHNFLNTMLKLAEFEKKINVVNDQIGAPTWSRQLANHTAQAIEMVKNSQNPDPLYGLYHLCASGSTNWYKFAEAIFKCRKLEVDLHPITSEQYNSTAQRPLNSLLSNTKFNAAFGVSALPWETALNECLNENLNL